MRSFQSVFLVAVFLLLSVGAVGQETAGKNPSEDQEKLGKDAVVFLRETMADVNNLRTLGNRVSFSAELAGLMWLYDEKEALTMYRAATGDFTELLMQYDMQMNSLGVAAGTDSFRGGMFAEVTPRSQLMRRIQTAIMVRQQIAMSIAEHDADLALNFYFDSLQAVSNPELRKQLESRDEGFIVQLMTEIAKTNVAKAAEFAARSIEKGVRYQHLELLKKIYAKDSAKGAEFAAAIFGRLKRDTLDPDNYYVVGSFLNIAGGSFEASKKDGGKKPMLSQSELRDLADWFGQAILNNPKAEAGSGVRYVDQIGKYSPSRALQIRTRFRGRNSGGGGATATFSSAPPPPRAVAGMANRPSNAGNAQRDREAEEKAKADKDLQEDVAKLGSKELSKDERQIIADRAREIVRELPGTDKKVIGLSALAAQVAKAGDKELALDIMRDAQSLVNPQPKNYQDFLLTWMLASGYAETDPEQAFPILDDAIMRANDTLAAFIKVGEFIDVGGEVIDDGEVQVGSFGGSMIRGLTSGLGMADGTLRTLAKADFNKTTNLASRFDRPEVRILAKMMILRAVLEHGKKPSNTETDIVIVK